MTFRFTGFRDGHCHPLFAARESAGPKLDQLDSIEAVLEALSAYLSQNPDCQWVDAGSVDRTLAASGGLTANLLDAVSAETPIVVHASDHHAIWVNTAALRLAGLEYQAPEIANAHIDVDPTGKPTGMLHEWDAMNLIYVHQPQPTVAEDLEAIERAQAKLLSYGVVAVQDAWIDPGMPEAYLEAVRLNRLKIRVNLAPRVAPQSWEDDLDFALETRSAVLKADSKLLTCNSVKIFIDGVIGSETAMVSTPYLDSKGCEVHAHLGTQIWQLDELIKMCLKADSLGFQLHFHAIGDAAVSFALDSLERVTEINGFSDRRPVIAHAELIDSADFNRLKSLGVIVCQQPVWAQPDDGFLNAKRVLGESRADRMYPIKSLMESGVRVSFGSDWPVSEPNPLTALFGAVQRTQPGIIGVAGESEAISMAQALEAHSSATAFQLGQELVMDQDWVELDSDISTGPVGNLTSAKVLRTCVAGKVVFQA